MIFRVYSSDYLVAPNNIFQVIGGMAFFSKPSSRLFSTKKKIFLIFEYLLNLFKIYNAPPIKTNCEINLCNASNLFREKRTLHAFLSFWANKRIVQLYYANAISYWEFTPPTPNRKLKKGTNSNKWHQKDVQLPSKFVGFDAFSVNEIWSQITWPLKNFAL